MTKLFLIRHGQSEWNKLNMIQGQKNTILTDLGREQALSLGNRLINEDIDIIYASDLSRAYTTAKIISDVIHKPLISSESLREINFGPWEGLSIGEIQEKYNSEYSIWLREPQSLNMKGAETLQILQERVMKYIDHIIDENKGKNIAVVSHGAALKALILGLLNIDISHYKNISLKNVSLSIIEFRDYNRVLTSLNDISHLKELSR
ncbi:histidine phosphatase family protein [Tissierella carlieri]|uniref:Histidine phosphatase family protein n=1 Tax=Tissierella carlieri TaxID=689904 RepID=A0ABT1S5Q5_9FIRM|nr:histidine phosphatase family protein [Tissierella carlieri]MCQ4921682.1 histidine phosphatase family protein [Tissierella carlieri]